MAEKMNYYVFYRMNYENHLSINTKINAL